MSGQRKLPKSSITELEERVTVIEGGGGGGSVDPPINVIISPATTSNIETFDSTIASSRKWILDIETATLFQSCEVLARVVNGQVVHVVYAIIGNTLNKIIDVSLSGNNMILKITNNEAVNMSVEARVVR